MTRYKKAYLSILLALLLAPLSFAQQTFVQDYNNVSTIPNTIAIQASETHLYALSETEGMVVFRIYPDSLQWLYTSSGMQRRGDEISADIRFAYLFGKSRRLTVLEPTSVLGVYSATYLPSQPLGVTRIENNLYVALGKEGLGRLSLDTPETVDTDITLIGSKEVDNASVLDVASSMASKQLLALTSNQSIILYEAKDNELKHSKTFDLKLAASKLFIDGERIWTSTKSGDIYEINSNGLGRKIGSVNEEVSTVLAWQDYTFVRGETGKVWVSKNREQLSLWKPDGEAGNYLTKSLDRVWISENNSLTRIMAQQANAASTPSTKASGKFAIKKIEDRIITFPNPLIMALELEGNYPTSDVKFTYRSNSNNAKIQKQGFVWQPTPSQLGLNWFTIIASNANGESDSTRFTVDVRSFNSPPSFSPIRGSSIVVNEKFELQFKATDPENPSSQLIRYIGVDLPLGSQINERNGMFSWTPNERQVGDNTFKVIASDEYGAASSIEITLKVLDIARDEKN